VPYNLPNRLIIFTRYPEPGKAKTRLIPALGPRGAADLQRQMTETTISTARSFSSENGTGLEVCYEGGNPSLMRDWLGQDLSFRPQGPGDLGKKMTRAFAEAFAAGSKRVMIIGADCPTLSPKILVAGLAALADHDLILGPASDGGYYLVGLTTPCPQLFRGQPWGSEQLLLETMATAEREAISFLLLEELNDVDRPEDLIDLGDHPYPE
jgi:rSAM/selenodomain-associated transferase 1